MANSNDVLKATAGNRMGQLLQEINDLKAILKKMDNPEKKAELRKTIMEKETYYNVLADRRRVNGLSCGVNGGSTWWKKLDSPG